MSPQWQFEGALVAIRVLLVEDEGIIRMMTAEMLQDGGFEVVEAWNGVEAVKLLDRFETIDIVLTDVRMPGPLDGIDVATHARRLHPDIPLIVVSGYAHHLMARLATFSPAAVYIGKPYSLEEIDAAVRQCTMQA